VAVERILIIQLRQLGDILLTTPCIRAVKKERPKAVVTVLSHAMGRLVLDDCPYMDEHFFYGDGWTWRQQMKLARTLRERRFDLVIDFMNNPRSAFYTRVSGAPERVSFRTARRLAYTSTIPRPDTPDYIVRHKFLLLKAAGFKPTDERLILPWSQAHTQPFMRFYATTERLRQAPLRVALSPTHRRAVRRWPLAFWAQLAARLVRDWGAAVVWLHGPGEEEVIDEVMTLCSETTLKAPKTSFRELAALVGNMDLFVGNSNGPSHVAVAGDVCSLQLHGPTTAQAWCPINDRHRVVQSPEYVYPEKTARMETITVERVWSELAAMRPVIEASAQAARVRGPRLSWR